MCDDTKFHVGGSRGKSEQMCSLSYRVNRKTYALFPMYALCHICKNIPSELGFNRFLLFGPFWKIISYKSLD